MDYNFIRVYAWNYANKRFEVTKLKPFDEVGRSCIYSIINGKIYDAQDTTTPLDLEFVVDDMMLNSVTDKTTAAINGIYDKSIMTIEYAYRRPVATKCNIMFAVAKENNNYDLLWRIPNNKKQIDFNGRVIIPRFIYTVNYMISHYVITQTIDDVIKGEPDVNIEDLKKDFGNFIIDEINNFVMVNIVDEIKNVKRTVGYRNNVEHRRIYEEIKSKVIPKLNDLIKPYVKMSSRKCSYVFNDATRKIEFIEE